ncbi:hypothetical protein PR202_gb05628 [Eleusine coracana subsp. coracana]|uniref:Uncharacterized protein n=1 Tax=Eleusine coracana subsp. coracana TaxID=191504 RepID=A0AAV5E528_ELECO|nr:hypothetical protein PR202_gb05628 [Eleusine coracana subsp. coracana]
MLLFLRELGLPLEVYCRSSDKSIISGAWLELEATTTKPWVRERAWPALVLLAC